MGLMLQQHKYTFDILTRVGIISCKPIDTPISTSKAIILLDLFFFFLILHDFVKSWVCQIIGALQYFTFTRPDICFVVNRVYQFMHAPTNSY